MKTKSVLPKRLTPFLMNRSQSYPALLNSLKVQIRQAQIRASLSVNRELISLYWAIGKIIVNQQKTEEWGKSVVACLSRDLRHEFPEMAGFSPRNIWRMRSFYLAYTRDVPILPQAVAELDGVNLPRPVAEIPWGHNAELLERLKNSSERIWYAKQTIVHGWSRNILVHQIQSKLIKRQGKALTNFHAVLPPHQSDMARELLKDPYNFDFLSLGPQAQERDLESGLMAHLRRFLLELGVGFAFMGQQYPLEVGKEDYFLDLLFYHTRLHCYVVVELKGGPFKPEHAGKMNFYLSAVDAKLRKPGITQVSVFCSARKKIV